MSGHSAKKTRSGRAVVAAMILGAALGVYSLIAWGTAMFTGGWQIGLAGLILLTAPPLLWWLATVRQSKRG